MSLIKVLRQKRADLTNAASAMFDLAATENRGLTAEEAARDDEIGRELTELDAQIARAERDLDRRRALGAVEDPNAAAHRQGQEGVKGFGSLGEQLMAVRHAADPDRRSAIDPRLVAGPTGLNESVGADGGFLVQTDFVGDLLQNVWNQGEIASRIRKIPVGPASNGIRMNGLDETSRADGQRWGGIRAFWTAEAGLKNASQPRWKRMEMELTKLTGLLYATDELLQDATSLEGWIREAFPEEFTFKVEDAVMNGTGAGMPLGFLNSGATIIVPKETSQPAATLTARNVLDMWVRMPPRSRNKAVWLINAELEASLFVLNLPLRNVAGTENVGALPVQQVTYTPPGTNPGQTYGLLMGRPVIPVEYAAPLGTAGDISLVDLSQYLGIDKGGVQSAASIHVRFIYDETVFRFVYRFMGQPIPTVPITPYRGTLTQSPFVTLATRA